MNRFFNNPSALIMLLVMAYMAISSGRFASPMHWLTSTLLLLPGIMIALTFHEFAHAFVAYRQGDHTPMFQRRVTLNPMAHLDPIGLLCIVFIGFGWGKPVMVNPGNFKSPRRDEILVSLAGVSLNLILAFVFGFLWMLYHKLASDAFLWSAAGDAIDDIIIRTIWINLVLMVFNLLPVPPLDGFNAISSIFNIKHTELYYKIYENGMFILMALIIFRVVSTIIEYTVSPLFGFIIRLFM